MFTPKPFFIRIIDKCSIYGVQRVPQNIFLRGVEWILTRRFQVWQKQQPYIEILIVKKIIGQKALTRSSEGKSRRAVSDSQPAAGRIEKNRFEAVKRPENFVSCSKSKHSTVKKVVKTGTNRPGNSICQSNSQWTRTYLSRNKRAGKIATSLWRNAS